MPGLGFGGVEVQGQLEEEYHRVTPHLLLPDQLQAARSELAHGHLHGHGNESEQEQWLQDQEWIQVGKPARHS